VFRLVLRLRRLLILRCRRAAPAGDVFQPADVAE